MLAPIAQGAEGILISMRYLFCTLVIIGSALAVSAQTTEELRQNFSGKQITLRIDVPVKDGVNIYPERSQTLDYGRYAKQLKDSSNTIKRGSVATVSDLKVESKRIEVEFVDKQNRTSSFKIRFQHVSPWMLTAATVIDALKRYVEFADADKNSAQLRATSNIAAGYVRNGVVHLGPRTTYLKVGLTTEEVTKLLGQPSLTSSADNGERLVYEFHRGEGRVLIAEFVGNSLVSSRLETRS